MARLRLKLNRRMSRRDETYCGTEAQLFGSLNYVTYVEAVSLP